MRTRNRRPSRCGVGTDYTSINHKNTHCKARAETATLTEQLSLPRPNVEFVFVERIEDAPAEAVPALPVAS